MDANRFDSLTRSLSSAGSRRGALVGLLASSLVLLDRPTAVARTPRRAEAKQWDDTRAEACIPTGQKCPAPKPRGRRGKNRRPKQLGCNQCCQRRVSITADGKKVCTCAPTGEACTGAGECCGGVCTGGVCSSTPPRDTCPARTCCRCVAGGAIVSCTLLPAGASTTDCAARCDPNVGILFTPRPGVETMVCSGADCAFASCPI